MCTWGAKTKAFRRKLNRIKTVELAKREEIHRGFRNVGDIFKTNFYLFVSGNLLQSYVTDSLCLK